MLTFAAAGIGAGLPPLAFAVGGDSAGRLVWAALIGTLGLLSGLAAAACQEGLGGRGRFASPIAAGVLCAVLSAPLTLVALLVGPALLGGGLADGPPPP
ncbi:hypothetical protein [Alienimonas californiensis]|uniref:hypothetical protein n=1 Tax=Alienimonas californiensis TaxID=2527989 RepID=UPI00119CCB59|nr:hypothetical protein [Alienimonas californiensis]